MVQLHDLITKYDSNKEHYCSLAYNETQLRIDFLDPLFFLLGWDITNQKNKSTSEREVLVEEGLKESKSSNTKKPDYTFRLFSDRKFFLEAKKPSIDISKDSEPAKQIRRYGFTAKLKISVLSNFEYLIIYDTSGIVNENDKASNHRISIYHYTEYEKNFNKIRAHLGRESVYSGKFDNEWSFIEEKINKFSIDDLFLKQLNEWRLQLSQQLLGSEPNISEEKINDLTQSYINSLFFLRVCEDRNLETYQTLLSYSQKKDVSSLVGALKKADRKYNSGLFELEYIDDFLSNPKSCVWGIIDELYYPKSTYSFVVLPSDILGNIYEIFLGKKIVIENGKISIKPQKENIDRDIVSTPIYIVRDILRKTITDYCQGKIDEEILNSKFGDIACGSGAFLLEAFQILQDHLIDYYIINDPSQLQQLSINSYKLTFEIKKRLLTSCIFGIDKDFNAVKACQFGLLLKLLEGESNETITAPVLPPLDQNICFGNSLVSYEQCPDNLIDKINPFNFDKLKFDVIFGNPPYMATEDMKQITPHELPLYKKCYISSHKQFDKYFVFVERGMELLNSKGYFGYILPSKFMKVGAGEKLRKYLSSNQYVSEIISFGANQIFKNKTTYTCILIARKQTLPDFSFVEGKSLPARKTRKESQIELSKVDNSSLTSDVWILETQTQEILKEIYKKTVPLEDVLGKKTIENGIQTSANNEYIHKIEKEDDNFLHFKYEKRPYKVEKELTRPYYQTVREEDTLHAYRLFQPNSFVIYPYQRLKNKIAHVPYNELKKNYPSLFHYLNKIRDKLDNNKRDIKPKAKSANEWYRYGRHQSLDNCDVDQKIIVGILSNGYKYAVDNHRTFISSGGTAGYCLINVPKNTNYSPYYIQALLSSKYMEWFASLYGEIFRGGFIARGTKVLRRMPIIPINFDNKLEASLHNKIVKLQKSLIKDFTQLDTASERDKLLIDRKFNLNKNKLDNLIKGLYNLGKKDSKIPEIEELYKNVTGS